MKNLIFLFFIKIARFLHVIGFDKIRGFARAYSFIVSKFNPHEPVLINVLDNKMYVKSDDKGVIAALIKDGVMEREEYETKLFREIVKEGMVVIDIGAASGYYSLIAAKLVCKGGIVYAFEPEPNNYELLCKNIEVNEYTNVIHFQKAVSNTKGRVKLYIDKFDMLGHSFCEATRLDSSHNSKNISFVWAKTITLDEFFENTIQNNKADIIKMNVEGAEGLIVEGAEKILKSSNPKIFMEFWPFALKNLGSEPLELLHKLQKYGFKIKFINEALKSLEPVGDINKFCQAAANFSPAAHLLLEK